MSIFRKASELNNVPQSVNNAFFEDHSSMEVPDEFAGLLKEASSDRSIYENRVKEFNKVQAKAHEFEKPQPTKYAHDRYANLAGGIRRVGEGQRFDSEQSELFVSDKIRSTEFDNNKYAENMLNNGFSIWEPQFDDLQDAFTESQKQTDAIFDRRTAAEKRTESNRKWEAEKLSQVRKTNILPYRAPLARLANDQGINHSKFGSADEFYAEAQDTIQQAIRQSNADRKTKISRQGADPKERREQWENKEAISARTMSSLQNSSFLAQFADKISLDEE